MKIVDLVKNGMQDGGSWGKVDSFVIHGILNQSKIPNMTSLYYRYSWGGGRGQRQPIADEAGEAVKGNTKKM